MFLSVDIAIVCAIVCYVTCWCYVAADAGMWLWCIQGSLMYKRTHETETGFSLFCIIPKNWSNKNVTFLIIVYISRQSFMTQISMRFCRGESNWNSISFIAIYVVMCAYRELCLPSVSDRCRLRGWHFPHLALQNTAMLAEPDQCIVQHEHLQPWWTLLIKNLTILTPLLEFPSLPPVFNTAFLHRKIVYSISQVPTHEA